LEHIDSIGVHHGRKPMRDQARDRLLAGGDVANGLADLFLGQRIERGCRLVEYQQLRIPEQRAGDREALLFSARYFHATLANQGIEAAIGTQKQALHGSLPQHVQALLVSRVRLDDEQVLADRSREQLRILGHESDPLAQMLDLHLVFRGPVVIDVTGLRPIQTDQQLYECALAGARGSHERDRLAARRSKRNLAQGGRRSRLVLERDIVEAKRLERLHSHRMLRARLRRQPQDRVEILKRDLCFPVDVDHIPELLQRTEYEERVYEQRKELADADSLGEDEIQHQEQDRRPQQVDAGALYEAQTAQVAHFLQLQLEDLGRGRVEPCDLLLGQTQTFNELDVAQRLGGRPGERGCLPDDVLLHLFDLAAQHRAQAAQQRHGEQIGGRDGPVYA